MGRRTDSHLNMKGAVSWAASMKGDAVALNVANNMWSGVSGRWRSEWVDVEERDLSLSLSFNTLDPSQRTGL